MEGKNYLYYRAGILLARFVISPDAVLCSVRSFETLRWQPETEFSIDRPPFDRELDLRLPDAIRCVQRGGFDRENYQFYRRVSAEIAGAERTGELWVQMMGHNPLDILLCDGEMAAFYDNERNYIGLLVREGFEPMTPQAAFDGPRISKGVRGVRKLDTFMVPMGDGVRLATDVYLPADHQSGERLPAVLIRTCYRKDTAKQFFAFAHYGYAVIAQDTRGREDSEGEWQPIVNERQDGADTLNWIAEQPWSDGKVGMIGASYLAIVQWEAAASNNPHLRAMISMVTGGVPIRKIPEKGLGETIPFWEEWMDHEYYDEYWHRANWLVHQHEIDVPTLYVSGWYDDVGFGTMQAWDMNRRNCREHQKLIAGAWKHKMNISRDIHRNYYGPAAVRHDMFSTYLRWYDRHLKGIDNGIDREPPVTYYVIGENAWHDAQTWPPETAAQRPLYLRSGGHANTSRGDGRLSWSCPAERGEDHYTFDPRDPTPFLIDVSENECMVPEDYQEVERREDVLVFTTEPLEEDVTIAGEPVAILYAASDAKDTDWVVRVTDVDESGASIRMCDGLVRARFRKSFIEPKLLLPGEVVRYEIPLTWISARFRRGHRIRVEVTSGADNSVFPNPNTGRMMADETEWKLARQTVCSGGDTPSRVILPVL